MEYTITLTEEQEMAVLTDMMSIQEWLDNAIRNKARQCVDDIVTKSGRGSKFSKPNDKEKIIKDLKDEDSPLLKSAKQKEKDRPKP